MRWEKIERLLHVPAHETVSEYCQKRRKSTAKASQNLALMRSRCEFCANVGCRATPGERRHIIVVGNENTVKREPLDSRP